MKDTYVITTKGRSSCNEQNLSLKNIIKEAQWLKNFDQPCHKDLELLRFYITKDIMRIEKKIQNNNNDVLGYFVASLVDILIVLLFNDDYWKCSPLCVKIGCIVVLLLLFS